MMTDSDEVYTSDEDIRRQKILARRAGREREQYLDSKVKHAKEVAEEFVAKTKALANLQSRAEEPYIKVPAHLSEQAVSYTHLRAH